jgi:hypothetical protein
VLTEEDFRRIRREKRQTPNDQLGAAHQEIIDDSAMYNRERFEGDIGQRKGLYESGNGVKYCSESWLECPYIEKYIGRKSCNCQ